jgi:DMSO/TMAO reductase YedYZ molybdopterin-dependent catalytic subunit
METPTTTTRGQIFKKTVFAFAIFALLIAAGIYGFRAVLNAPKKDGVQAPLRKALRANEAVFSEAQSRTRLAKTYPLSAAAKNVRLNGNIGIRSAPDTAGWRLKVARGWGDTLQLSMADLRRLPKTEIVFDFKCIEGWHQVSHWAGVKMADFIHAYRLEALARKKYLGLRTPGGAYYVGIDMPSALHPQTILAYEMNGKPLTPGHGAPLRLIIPLKYGIKHLKRIGLMYFSDSRPPDYWAERGYDYFAGH